MSASQLKFDASECLFEGRKAAQSAALEQAEAWGWLPPQQ